MRKLFGNLTAFALSLILVLSIAPSVFAFESNDAYAFLYTASNESFFSFDAHAEFFHIDSGEVETLTQPINELGHGDINILDNRKILAERMIYDVQMPEIPLITPFYEDGKISVLNNNNPNNAIFINQGMMGQWLINASTFNDSWYFFSVNGGSKLTVAFEQPNGGLYAIALYRLIGNNLALVTYSMYGTNAIRQQFSYIAPNTNTYFLQVIPFIPVVGLYRFVINVSTVFDSAEVDDNQLDARQHTLPATLNQTLDNPFDVDWIRFSTGSADLINITLSNVPVGAIYEVVLFNTNLNVLASFAVAGSDSRAWNVPPNTTFYAKVRSQNSRYSASQSYRLELQAHSTAGYDRVHLIGGNLIGFTGNRMYVNGINVRLTGSLMHHHARSIPVNGTWITRDQQFVANNLITGITVHNMFWHGSYTHSILSDPSVRPISSSNAIMMVVSGVFYFYSHFRSPGMDDILRYTSMVYDYTFMIIDATTGRIIDFPEFNILRQRYNHVPRWNGQPLF